jgi:hypothetical protein
VEEANVARDLLLSLEKAHKEEESALRQVFDRKHLDQQIEYRKRRLKKNAELKNELLGKQIADEEQALDEKALEAFLAMKKAEQEKRQRQAEKDKAHAAKELDKQLQDKIKDHEDMLERKRQAAQEMEGQAIEIKRRLLERKRKLAEQEFQGLTDEEKKRAMEQAMSRYEALGHTYYDEKGRQWDAMSKRLALRKQRLEKMRRIRMVYGEEQQRKNAAEARSHLQQELSVLRQDRVFSENDELLRLLRAWAEGREKHHKLHLMKQLADTVLKLDPQLLSGLILKLKKVENSLKELRRARRRF